MLHTCMACNHLIEFKALLVIAKLTSSQRVIASHSNELSRIVIGVKIFAASLRVDSNDRWKRAFDKP